jgi:hypothetical protein
VIFDAELFLHLCDPVFNLKSIFMLFLVATVGIGIGIKKTKDGQFLVTKLAQGLPAQRSGHIKEQVGKSHSCGTHTFTRMLFRVFTISL